MLHIYILGFVIRIGLVDRIRESDSVSSPQELALSLPLKSKMSCAGMSKFPAFAIPRKIAVVQTRTPFCHTTAASRYHLCFSSCSAVSTRRMSSGTPLVLTSAEHTFSRSLVDIST